MNDERTEKALAVLERLLDEYGLPKWPSHDPVSELVSALLSHRTTNKQSGVAFQRLRERFPAWEQVRDAPTNEIEELIREVNWPDVKAVRIKQTLQRISAERGNLNIDFLKDLPLEQANAGLRTLPGVGPKSAALVLLFTMRRPIQPVDTHVHRVCQRLGIIDARTTAEGAHNILQSLLPADAGIHMNLHYTYIKHGQQVCVWRTPRCNACVVQSWCNYYHTRVEPQQNEPIVTRVEQQIRMEL